MGASDDAGVNAGDRARNFGIYEGDSCGDSADLGHCLIFKLGVKSTFVAPCTCFWHRVWLVWVPRGHRGSSVAIKPA